MYFFIEIYKIERKMFIKLMKMKYDMRIPQDNLTYPNEILDKPLLFYIYSY